MAEKYVVHGATCNCSLGSAQTTLNVNSHTINKIDGKLQATVNDKTFASTFGTCNIASPPPACTVSPTGWIGFAQSTRISGNLVLLKGSRLGCARGGLISIQNENQSVSENSEVPTNKIDGFYRGEIHFRRMLDEIDAAGVHSQPFRKGDYAVFANSVSNLIKTQSYGFDWIRDILDGEEDYFNTEIVNYNTIGGKQYCEIELIRAYNSVTGDYILTTGKLSHVVEYNNNTRKIASESFYFISRMDTSYIGGAPSNTPVNRIYKYDSNRNHIATYASGTNGYTTVLNELGGNYANVKSTILLSSYIKLVKDFAPVKQYINTPKGTLEVGRNLSTALYEINDKNYYVPWLALMRGATEKVQILSFLDAVAPSGEIRLNTSSPEITVNPTIIPIPPLEPYPTVYQRTSIPSSNIELIDITCSATGVEQDEIVEARFFDNSKTSDPEYRGEVIGLLNVLANKPHYSVNCYFVRVHFTDRSNKTGQGFPLNLVVGMDPLFSEATQLAKADDLRSLFIRGVGKQHQYIELMFKQALIEYNPFYYPDTPTNTIEDLNLDFDEFVTSPTVAGVDSLNLGSDISNISGNLLSALARKRALNPGITYFLLPFTIDGLYGQSDGIGGSAQSVIVTLQMFNNIARDRATAIHEGAHSLNLYHSFVEGYTHINRYLCNVQDRVSAFLDDKTENVMDYTPAGRSFYKWQWQRMQNDHPDVTQIL